MATDRNAPYSPPAGTADQRLLDPVLQVIGYHQETKHHFYRYARALGYMDWANQPNPFRRYEGAPLIPLPVLRFDEEPLSPMYGDLYRPGSVVGQPITVRSLSRFLEYALALSAWKETGGTRWALRSNPSSGNLHPTEGYLFMKLPGVLPSPGLYHYAPKEHALERRADWPDECFINLMKAFPPGAFLFALTSIHWRESWKYGERGFRYCQHDVGHALGAARIAAAALGWRMTLLDDLGDDLLAALLGINRPEEYADAEPEHPDCAAVIWRNEQASVPVDERPCHLPLFIAEEATRGLNHATWYGKANRLSRGKPDPWEIIDVVAAASSKPTSDQTSLPLPRPSARFQSNKAHDERNRGSLRAGHIIRQRRSALAFDGKTSLTATCFFSMLSRVFARPLQPVLERPLPWDVIQWDPMVHLALFVHRVEDLPPGLYMLIRDTAKTDELRGAMHGHFAWARPQGCPDDLPLFLLQAGDARRLATQVSCHQEIAGDGAFSLGMIAEFESSLRAYGAWFYRRLFWETGIIGQVLYLEAEAAGVRGTGIGCFFDDPVHQVFGFQDTRFQSLYHFTVGGHVEDPRLTTLPPYGSHTDRKDA